MPPKGKSAKGESAKKKGKSDKAKEDKGNNESEKGKSKKGSKKKKGKYQESEGEGERIEETKNVDAPPPKESMKFGDLFRMLCTCCCPSKKERKKYFQPYTRPHQEIKDPADAVDPTELAERRRAEAERLRLSNILHIQNVAAIRIQCNYRGHYHRNLADSQWKVAV